MARARLTPGERHEASPDDRSIGRRPWIGRDCKLRFTRHRVLKLDELLVSRRPRGDTVVHGAMMAPCTERKVRSSRWSRPTRGAKRRGASSERPGRAYFQASKLSATAPIM